MIFASRGSMQWWFLATFCTVASFFCSVACHNFSFRVFIVTNLFAVARLLQSRAGHAVESVAITCVCFNVCQCCAVSTLLRVVGVCVAEFGAVVVPS